MSTGAKMALLEEYASIARVLGTPARLQMLEALAQTERGVEALAERTGLSVANCSQHLQQLRRAGLVTGRRDGKQVIYALADEAVLGVMAGLKVLATRNKRQVRDILAALVGDTGETEAVSRAWLEPRLADGRVTVLDVRPEDEFNAGHISGAYRLPPEQIEAAAAHLPKLVEEVIAYCRGPYCIYAEQAAAALRRTGIRARVMEGGFPEWRREGRPVTHEFDNAP